MTAPNIPFIKWAGGKRWFVSRYSHLFPKSFNTYLEPFFGSGAIFFHLQPEKAVISDLNSDLIEMYREVRDNWRKIIQLLENHQHNHSKKYYYDVRSSIPQSRTEKAARLIYLNRTCWNGLYRVNLCGQFNVPIGTKNSVIFENDRFDLASEILKKAKILHQDFELVIDKAGPRDFIFADPPYTMKHNHNGFLKYNDKLFSWNDQIRLRDVLERADKRGAKFILTNADHKSIHNLYGNFESFTSIPRHSILAGKSSKRGPVTEILIQNFSS